MNTWVQAIGVPLVLGFSIAYLLFVAWASHRRRRQAEAERLAGPTRPDRPSQPEEPEPSRRPATPAGPAPSGKDDPHQRSNINTVKK